MRIALLQDSKPKQGTQNFCLTEAIWKHFSIVEKKFRGVRGDTLPAR